MAKLIDLTGATITFNSDKMTYERVLQFWDAVNPSTYAVPLPPTSEEGESVTLNFQGKVGEPEFLNTFFNMSKIGEEIVFFGKEYFLVSTNYVVRMKNFFSATPGNTIALDSTPIIIDIQPSPEDVAFVKEPFFLSFIEDSCDIEGGVWEEEEQLDTFLAEMGDAIREVKGTTNPINARDMVDIVRSMSSGSAISLQEKTITPSTSSQNVTPDSGYDGLSKVTVNPIPSSYVKPTATKGATTYIPTTSDQGIAAGTYLSGAQTIKGDTNLVAGNIKSGVSIFGVNGTYEGSGGGGGGSAETCNVTINVPGWVTMIGWGECSISLDDNNTSLPGGSLPSTDLFRHMLPLNRTYIFPSIPVGSTFAFYYNDGYIKGATVSDNIEFSFVEVDSTSSSNYKFATCRCNGDGEITINI